MVDYISDSSSANYVSDSIGYGILSFLVSAPIASVWRLVESHYFNPDLNPVIFGVVCTAGADIIRYVIGQTKFRDNPAIFIGSAAAYTAVSYLMR